MFQTLAATGGRLLFTFALARILGPEDFGVVAQATIYIALSMVLLDQGFGVALVQRRDLHEGDIRSVAALNVALGVGLMFLTLLFAPLVASFFRTPELTTVLRVLGVGLIVKGLAIVPMQLCRRAFQFRQLALLQTGAVIVAGIAGVIAATNGASYWALVVQTMLADAIVLAGLLTMRGLPRFKLDAGRLRRMMGFSTALLGSLLLTFAGQNVDNIVIGRALGPTALAFYAIAFRIQRFPLQLIGGVVNDVALSVFSRLQDERDRMLQWFLKATRLVTLLAWPPLVLLAVSSHVAIPLLFGAEWEPAVVPMQLLAVAGIIQIPRWLFLPLLVAHGRTDVVFFWSLLSVSVVTLSFVVAVRWGVNGVAAAAAIVPAIMALPQSVSVSRIVGFAPRSYLLAHVPATVSCAVLAFVWWAAATLLEENGTSPLGVLVAATVISLIAGIAVARSIQPTLFQEFRDLFSLSNAKRQPWGTPNAPVSSEGERE